MLSGMTISAPAEDDVEALASVLGLALHFVGGSAREWMAMLGPANFRAVKLGDRVVADLGLIEMGQWFGGACVPLAGVTAVGVAPDARGGGIGSALLRHTLEELRARGLPLSALYPATLPVYQRAGYERAGVRLTYELPIHAIDTVERGLDLIPIATGDYDEVYRLYEARARLTAGNLARPAWLWQRKLEPKDQPVFRYLVARDGQAEGYVVFTQGSRTEPVTVLDACTLTPAAGRRLLTLFAGYRSTVEHLVWSGGPLDPFIYLLREQLAGGLRTHVTITRAFDWMLRLVDVPAALQARGYPPGPRADLHLDVRDDLLPTNSGPIVLTVEDGHGQVRPGGAGHLRLGVRELAAIYTGFMAPAEVRALGAIEGSPDTLALAGAIFAGPRPWLADMF